MRPIELSPRLTAIAEQVPEGVRFVDVGTDHARLPVWLLERGRIPAAIATDLRPGPLASAQRTAARHRVLDRLSLRMGDGLAPVQPQEAQVIAVAGMGGETIAEILAAAPWAGEGGRTLFLQPMTSAPDLRRWLSDHGYVIREERLVREEKLYVVLRVQGGQSAPLTPAECWAGRQWKGMESPLRGAYLRQLRQRAELARGGLEQSGRPEDRESLARWTALAQGLEEMEKEWDRWQR